MSKLSNDEYVTQVYEETYLYITKFLTIKCRNTQDVSDLFQNTYMYFLTQVEKQGQAHIFAPRHYLLKIAKAELAKYYKDNKEKINIKDSLEILKENEYGENAEEFLIEDISEDKLMEGQIWHEIKKLDDLTVKVMALRYMHDMELTEIAKSIEVPLSTVKNRLYRGLEKVRTSINKGGNCDEERFV